MRRVPWTGARSGKKKKNNPASRATRLPKPKLSPYDNGHGEQAPTFRAKSSGNQDAGRQPNNNKQYPGQKGFNYAFK
jgi:hypothetical protein